MGTSAGQSQMLQMIIQLGDLQERKKARESHDTEYKSQLESITQRLGFEKGTEAWKQGQDLLKNLADAPPDARPDIFHLAVLLGVDPTKAGELSQTVAGLMKHLPESAANRQNRNVAAGEASMSPEDLQRAQQAAATSTMTGALPGQVAQSARTQQVVAAAPQGADYMRQLGVGSDAQSYQPLAGAEGQSLLTAPGGMIAHLARVRAGLEMTAGEAAGQATASRGLDQSGAASLAELDLRNRAQDTKDLKHSDILKILTDLGPALKQTQDKTLDTNARAVARARLNSMIRLLQQYGDTTMHTIGGAP